MAQPAAPNTRLHWRQERWWSWAALCCVLLLVAAVRFRLRDMPLERDEGEFAYGGQLLLQGIWPGHLLYTMKLPGTHAAYAILMALFGQSCAGVHLGLLTVNCATIALVFFLARAVSGPPAGPVAAATYGLLSLSGGALGTAGHATHFVVLAALAGLMLLWRASRTGRLRWYFGSGLLLGACVLMKHNGLLFVGFGAACLAWLTLSRNLGPTQVFWKAVALFCLGVVTPILLLLLVLWRSHTLENCWFWSVTYARAYAKPNPGLVLTWRILMQRMPPIMELPFYAGLLGPAALWRTRATWPAALFGTGFLLVSVLAVVPGFHFRPHYYVLLMPALAVLTGVLVQQATEWIANSRPFRSSTVLKLAAAVPLSLFALLLARGIAREKDLFFNLTPVQACRLLYGSDLFPEARVLGDYLREHTPPDERIAVVGSEPEIFFYAHRHSATGYVYTYPLAERQPFALEMREQMRAEIEATQPAYLIQVRTWTSWLSGPGSPRRIDELCNALTPPQYRLAGTNELAPDGTQMAGNGSPDAGDDPPGPASVLLVFKRY
jgi:hypothetical protein